MIDNMMIREIKLLCLKKKLFKKALQNNLSYINKSLIMIIFIQRNVDQEFLTSTSSNIFFSKEFKK